MKKGSYWFGSLSEKEQEEFKQNFFLNKKESIVGFEISENPFETFCLYREFSSLREFVLFAFIWTTTNQGFQYWSEISYRNVSHIQ